MPIQEPDEDQTFAAWIREHAEDGISTRLEIVPSKAQTNSWQIKHGNKVIPIGEFIASLQPVCTKHIIEFERDCCNFALADHCARRLTL